MKRAFFGTAAILSLALATPAVLAQDATVFKWTDAEGTTHYSDQPPANSKAEQLPIRVRRGDRPSSAGKAKAKAEATVANNVNPQEEDVAPAAEAGSESEKEQLLKERQDACEKAKSRASQYDSARRVYRPGPAGERVYLTDEELDTERANARRSVSQWCDDN
jgi:Domain of unknown function (DUF4124)